MPTKHSIEQMRQSAIDDVAFTIKNAYVPNEPLGSRHGGPWDNGLQSTIPKAFLYIKKFDADGGSLAYPSVADAIDVFNSILLGNHAEWTPRTSTRSVSYVAVFDTNKPDWYIPVCEFPEGRLASTTTAGEQMNALIGRHGGGGGHGGGHGGHGGHGHGGGRRFFGGGGGYGWYPYGYGWDNWAYPYGYGNQGATEEVEEVEETVTGNELMELLPAMAPPGGVTTTQELGHDLVLRVSICVDGRCYCGEVDLSAVLSDIAAGVTAEHARAHGAHDVAETIEVGRRHQRMQGQGQTQHHHHHGHHRHHHRRQQDQQDQGQQDQVQQDDQAQPSIAPIVQPTALDPSAAAAQLAAALAAVQAAAQAATASQGGGRRDGKAPADSAQAVSDVKRQGDAAVKAAGDVLMGALYDQHFNAPELGFRPGDFSLGLVGGTGESLGLVGGWWDDIKGAAVAAVAPVYAIHKAIASNPDVAKLLNDHKGEISMAAGAVATAYGGPAGGAAAAQLTGPMIDSLANGNSTQLIAGLAKQAQSDPTVAQAMQTAQKAVAQTTAAYHLTDTAARAASGDRVAARKIAQVDRAASGGDAAARSAMEIIAHAFRILQGGGSPTIAGATPRGASSAAQARALRREGAVAAEVLHAQGGARVIGFVKTRGTPSERPDGIIVTMTDEIAMPFPSLDNADDWFGSLDPSDTVYAAYYDAGDPTWPAPLNETFGRSMAQPYNPALDQSSKITSLPQNPTSSGGIGVIPWLGMTPPWLALTAAGAAGYWLHGQWQKYQARQ